MPSAKNGRGSPLPRWESDGLGLQGSSSAAALLCDLRQGSHTGSGLGLRTDKVMHPRFSGEPHALNNCGASSSWGRLKNSMSACEQSTFFLPSCLFLLERVAAWRGRTARAFESLLSSSNPYSLQEVSTCIPVSLGSERSIGEEKSPFSPPASLGERHPGSLWGCSATNK